MIAGTFSFLFFFSVSFVVRVRCGWCCAPSNERWVIRILFIYVFNIIKCVLDERAVERSTKKANSNFVTSINRNCFTTETIHELLSLVNAIRNY